MDTIDYFRVLGGLTALLSMLVIGQIMLRRQWLTTEGRIVDSKVIVDERKVWMGWFYEYRPLKTVTSKTYQPKLAF